MVLHQHAEEEGKSTADDDYHTYFHTRLSWGRHIEFVFTCIGFAVGLGNIWRFPHLTYSNGGGAFLIPYFISLVFMGIPLFCLEILIGQFASRGPITLWSLNPMLKGLGYTMVFLSGVITIYYNIIVAQGFIFLFSSMNSVLPWTTCDNDWNTCACYSGKTNFSDLSSLVRPNSSKCFGVPIAKKDMKTPSEEYYNNRVLEKTAGIQEPGIVKWDLTLCNLLAWTIICFSLIKGVKTMGKAVYFFALAPYVLLSIIIVRGATLEGAGTGISYYLTPDFSVLRDSKVWRDASSQIFFSLSCCTGSLTAMSSYNKFKNNSIKDSLLVPVINCFTSFISGFAVFSVLGFMSANSGKSIENVTTTGTGLIFIAYPEALAAMPLPQLWSILFFSMLICLGLSTQFPSWETVLTACQDEFKLLQSKRNAIIFRISSCILGFLLGLPMTTQGGSYLMDLCDFFVAFPLLFVGFLEVVGIVWIYGPKRFREDILLMIGHCPLSSKIFKHYFYWNFLLTTPLLIFAIIVFEAVMYMPITSTEYPEWAEGLGWLLVTATMIWIPIFAVFVLWRHGEWRAISSPRDVWQQLKRLTRPTEEWGPALPANCANTRYEHKLRNSRNGRMLESDDEDAMPKTSSDNGSRFDEQSNKQGAGMPLVSLTSQGSSGQSDGGISHV